jgi:ribosomal protein S2
VIYNSLNTNNNKFNYNFINTLNYKYLIDKGLHLAGSKLNYNIRNSSIVYAKRQNLLLLDLIKNSIQFKKILKLIEIISFKRGVIYFIQNNTIFKFNSLLVKNPGVHLLKRNTDSKYLESVFLFNKWTPGFLTNNFVFFNQLKKKLSFPRLPHLGIIGDHNMNLYILKEFIKLNIPTASCIDVNSQNTELSLYNLTFNGKSQDALILFF